MDKLNILGTPYSVSADYDKLSEFDGETFLYKKEIHVKPINMLFFDEENVAPEEKITRYKHVMRHEIIHAFMFEAGMTDWSQDEMLVEFLASTAPKLFAIYKEHNLLD